MRTLAVIDGNSLMHRAFHAVPPTMNAPDGRPTNACFGFLSMLLKFVEEFKPDALVCAFDAGIPQFRLDAIAKYKAQRPPTDPDLKAQFPIMEELLAAMDVPTVRVQGWEGDDILGTLAQRAREAGDTKTLLVTGDKDALQLVDETTFVVNTRSGMTDIVIYDDDAVIERFGVPPRSVADYLGLMGDSSDNIPGVPGVGAKTAAKLLAEHGSMDAVLAAADGIKGKLGEKIRENREQALASREVATIISDVPVELNIGDVSFPSFSAAEVEKVFGSFGFVSHLRRVLRLAGENAGGGLSGSAAAQPVAAVRIAVPAVDVLAGEAAWKALEAALAEGGYVACHLQSADPDSLFAGEQELYAATHANILVFAGDEIRKALERIVCGGQLAAFDVKSILKELYGGAGATPSKALDALDGAVLADLALAAYLLDSSKQHADAFALADVWLPGSTAQLAEGPDGVSLGASAALCVRELLPVLKAALEEDGSMPCYHDIEMPLIPLLADMEHVGVKVEPALLGELSAELAAVIDGLREKAYAEAGCEFNLDSPKQLGEVLFERLKLPARKKKRTGYSTDASVLADLKDLNPLPGIMLEYRELAKLKNTYLDALPALVASDGHIHTTFNQAVTATGRLSSSEPNLQNIPVRSELGRKIRRAFVADPGAIGASEAVFLAADYSQIELRLLAHLSADEHLIAAFASGEDFHAATAARVFGLPASEVTPELRSRAKAVNFGIVYGQQAYGLSQSLKISHQEAKEMIERYFAAYPGVRAYLDGIVAQAQDLGWVETLFGRKRHIHELRSANPALRSFGERTAMNHPMQGSAADIFKLAMIAVRKSMQAAGCRSQMVMQVHDELDFNCAIDELDELSALVKEAMEGVVALKVPLAVNIAHGKTWADAH